MAKMMVFIAEQNKN